MRDNIIPKTGLKGLAENWQSDLIAAVSVAMVAMPLCLGIALASGVPPLSGVLSAIVGGVVTTFFRGGHISINGPGAGLIAVLISSLAILDDGTGQSLNYLLAAIVVSGVIQTIMGIFKMGRYADVFHSSVIRGILAAIGIIIISKQIHIALGTNITKNNVIDSLKAVFTHAGDINPFVFIISLIGLLLLIYHSKISYKLFHFLPAPMWVLLISIPFAYLFNFFEPHTLNLFGNDYYLGPHLLIDIPANLMDAITYPNFSKIDTWPFWSSVISITVISTIESLASGKAVDKLDPYKRKTNLNKDLVGIGLSTIISGALGGLPVITVIVRSTVNIHNNAKTRWSNLYHGLLLLAFIFLMAPMIQQVPLSALAILLVFTGMKLASPKVFQQVYNQGIEQLIFFVGTLALTLYTNLLIGISGGLLLALGSHFLLAKMPPTDFLRAIYKSGTTLFPHKNGTYDLNIKGIANFLATLNIDKLLHQIPGDAKVTIDLSAAKIVDFTILEHLYEFQRSQRSAGGQVEIVGLEKHISSTNHKLGLKIQTDTYQKLTPKQISLQQMADEEGWKFYNKPIDDVAYFETFYFFMPRPIEFKSNTLTCNDSEINWEITDITFEEGAYPVAEEYNTTLGLINLPYSIPKFTIEKERFFSRYLELPGHKDIDYVLYKEFPNEYVVKVEDREAMREFMTDELKELIIQNDIHHLESNGKGILLFSDHFKFAQTRGYIKLITFIEEFKELVEKN